MRAQRFCFVLYILLGGISFGQSLAAGQTAPAHTVASQAVQPVSKSLPAKTPQDQLPKKVRLAGSIYIPFQTFENGKPIQGGGFLLLPPNLIVGKDKVPVVVIMHGSSGVLAEHEYVYARELVKMGVAAYVVDLFTPRGVISTHENQQQIQLKDATRDAFIALYALRAEPRVDTQRAGILGFSKGANVGYMTAMHTVRKARKVGDSVRYKAHYLFYPGCSVHYFDNRTTGAPITLFLGEKDDYNGVTQCQTLAGELKAKGADIKTILYKDAYHAWDNPLAVSHPRAEVYKNCRFDQQANGAWIERKSGVTNIPGLGGAMYEKALKGCLTYGETSKENKDAAKQSMEDFKALVKEQL